MGCPRNSRFWFLIDSSLGCSVVSGDLHWPGNPAIPATVPSASLSLIRSPQAGGLTAALRVAAVVRYARLPAVAASGRSCGVPAIGHAADSAAGGPRLRW